MSAGQGSQDRVTRPETWAEGSKTAPGGGIAPQHTRMIESCGSCSTLICPHGLCRTCSRCEQCEENLQLLDLQGKPSRWARRRVRAVSITERPEERFGLVGRALSLDEAMVMQDDAIPALCLPSQDSPGPRDEPDEVDAEAEAAPHHRCTPRYPASPDTEVEA